jgi:hypothetical protein
MIKNTCCTLGCSPAAFVKGRIGLDMYREWKEIELVWTCAENGRK